jgi:hypothetical protein
MTGDTVHRETRVLTYLYADDRKQVHEFLCKMNTLLLASYIMEWARQQCYFLYKQFMSQPHVELTSQKARGRLGREKETAHLASQHWNYFAGIQKGKPKIYFISPENGGSMFPRNVDIYLQVHMTLLLTEATLTSPQI